VSYCQKHWKDTILLFEYERTGCPPRISDEVRDNLRKEKPSTAPNLEGTDNYFDYFKNGRARSAKPAHSSMCPGFNKIGVEGFCTFNRHILNTSEAPDNLEDGDPKEVTAARVATPRKTKAAFTNTHVVSTPTTYGHNYAPPRGDSRGDTDYDGEGDGSSVRSGHHSDPKEFDEDDDPSCSPTCRCKKCYTSSESSEGSESEPDDKEVGPTVSLATYVQRQQDRLSGRTAERIVELLLMLNDLANPRANPRRLSRPEIERRIERLCKFQQRLDE
jgi:hypothetical protein